MKDNPQFYEHEILKFSFIMYESYNYTIYNYTKKATLFKDVTLQQDGCQKME